jgi:hypothetical protein
MGWDWPFSPYWFALIVGVFSLLLFFHGRAILSSTLPGVGWKLIILRFLSGLLFLFLLARPFVTSDEPNPKEFKLLTFTDLSGSMNTRDGDQKERRIGLVRPFFDSENTASWISNMRDKYGRVESFGFSDTTQRLSRNSWNVTELGQKTAIGDVLSQSLKNEKENKSLGSVVVFSDGRNNLGSSVLEVAKEFRAGGIPVNVVGVGREQPVGDLAVTF